MSISDGTVGGLSKLFDSGSPSARWNLVIVADGYRSDQQAQFGLDAQALCDHFLAQQPFDEPAVAAGINIYRLDVASTDAGADKPQCCTPLPANPTPAEQQAFAACVAAATPTTARTYFDSTFCSDGKTRRLLYGDAALVKQTVVALLPSVHQIVVLVNDTERGGGGGEVAWSSTGGLDWRDVVVHEIGHSAFGLADEYDSPYIPWTGEPEEPNVTAVSNPSTVKWSHLVTAGAANPSRANPTCGTAAAGTDPGPNPLPPGTVGTFEGAKYTYCGAYRPVWECKMRVSTRDFCPVCLEAIRNELVDFLQPEPSGDVELATPVVDFNDVVAGMTVRRAARFNVSSAFPITLQVTVPPQSPFAVDGPALIVAPPAGPIPWPAYVVFRFTAGTSGTMVIPSQVTIRCLETSEDFVVTLVANVVERPTIATQLVFDQSGSMLSQTDEGRTKEDVLKDSARVFVDLLWDDNGIGINTYDEDAHLVMDVKVAGPLGGGGGRDGALDKIANHSSNASGMTAIGDGIEMARNVLDAATGEWDQRSMIVLTDGMETASKRIEDVADSVVNEKVFAIGLGTAEQIQPAALNALTNGTGGYLLMTGNLTAVDTFLLEKYYLQILAGVNNNEIVLDPEGLAVPDRVERIPFDLTDGDVDFTAVVLGRPANALQLGLEAPNGEPISLVDAGIQQHATPRSIHLRVGLPQVAAGKVVHGGRWHLLVSLGKGKSHHVAARATASQSVRGIRFSANVLAFSNLRMAATVDQDRWTPGATMTVQARITEYGYVFQGTANVSVDIVRPDGGTTVLAMDPVQGDPGTFRLAWLAHQSGVYRFKIVARGRTKDGQRFMRETLRTGMVWRGKGEGSETGKGDGGKGSGIDMGRLLECLLKSGAISKDVEDRLRRCGVDVDAIRRCVRAASSGK